MLGVQAEIVKKLVEAFQKALDDDRPEVAYHCANILEWISYTYPSAFSLDYSETLIETFCSVHLVAARRTDWPIAVRIEAIWSLGWASVSLPKVYELTLDSLERLERNLEKGNIPWLVTRIAWSRGNYPWGQKTSIT